MRGTVKFFNESKGFGFIIQDNDEDIFVHKSGLRKGTTIVQDDTVEFDTERGKKGMQAVNVEKM